MKSLLIKDTTREERLEMVNAEFDNCETECNTCHGCDALGFKKTREFYQPYIDGEKELLELTMPYLQSLIK